MTTKQDKKPVPFIKAVDLTKQVKRFATVHAGDFQDLPSACLHEANGLVKELLIRKANRLIEKNDYIGFLLKARAALGILGFTPSDKYVELALKLAKRLEREFLRNEEKDKNKTIIELYSKNGYVPFISNIEAKKVYKGDFDMFFKLLINGKHINKGYGIYIFEASLADKIGEFNFV